jgi:hypothetical protein
MNELVGSVSEFLARFDCVPKQLILAEFVQVCVLTIDAAHVD